MQPGGAPRDVSARGPKQHGLKLRRSYRCAPISTAICAGCRRRLFESVWKRCLSPISIAGDAAIRSGLRQIGNVG
jgi:hypothetical protein